MGGTFSSRALDYQEWFIKRAIEAMNDFSTANKDCKSDAWRKENKIIKIGQEKKSTYILLEDVIKSNETAKVRNVGMTFETRPDWISKFQIYEFLKLGGTKVELGVQSVFNDRLDFIKRGHSVEESIRANKMLRNFGFKVGFHMMLGLHNGDISKEIEEYKILYEDQNFKPDYIKIYPTLVTEGTELYKLWKNKMYSPITDELGIELIAKIKKYLPRWTRVQRIQRDIPSFQIVAGIKKSNIREKVQKYLNIKKERCECIRCREIGHKLYQNSNIHINSINPEMKITSYHCCDGKEFFIELVDNKTDTLIGFCRLRLPSFGSYLFNNKIAIIRELHVYGSLTPVGMYISKNWQHKGYGGQLIKKAENIAKKYNFEKIAVTSGIGVREYYRKYNYVYNGIYMIKKLNK